MAYRSTAKLVGIALVLAVTGCRPMDVRRTVPGAAPVPPAAPAAPADTHWIVTHIEGRPVLADTEPTLKIAGDSVTGFGGCNTFGAFLRRDRPFGLDNPIITLIGCRDAIGKQESTLLDSLTAVVDTRLEGDRLQLLDDEGRQRISLIRRRPPPGPQGPMAGTGWRLAKVDGEPVPESAQGWLAFIDASSYRTRQGCLRTWGVYSVGRYAFALSQRDAHEARCSTPEDSLADQRRMGPLQHVVQHWLQDGRLHVLGRNGRRLVFEACSRCMVEEFP